ncbi:transposase, partial [Candidatus Magnetomorum sp. HK-1]
MNRFFEKLPKESKSAIQLPEGICEVLGYAVTHLKGSNRRIFMAKTVCSMGEGGQRIAETVLGWNRGTIRKGMHELKSGINCIDNYSSRGRDPIEKNKLKNLRNDIKEIVKPSTQADPTFRTTKIYTPLTAKTVRERLIEDKKYSENDLPTIRTIQNKLNDLKFHPQNVIKCKPLKKIAETDAIFEKVFAINKKTDEDKHSIRLSIDAKAKVNVGPFSRGGKSRQGEKASDHAFKPETILTHVGISLPYYDKSYFYFTESKVTAGLMKVI